MHTSSAATRHFLRPGTPEYERPPVIETALGIQFNHLQRFSAVHYGAFHEAIRDDFPHSEDQSPLPAIIEKFPRLPESVTLDVAPYKLPRVWYMDKPDGHSFIQLQRDRIVFNWRKMESDEEDYPSYEENARRFIEAFDKFVAFAERYELGKVEPNLCEVIYVNFLSPSTTTSAVNLLHHVLVGQSWDSTAHVLPEPEESSFNRCFVINDNLGRLFAEASTVRKGDEEAIQLKLTARVIHDPESMESIRDTLEIAHNWVVNGFADLLDREYQENELGRIK